MKRIQLFLFFISIIGYVQSQDSKYTVPDYALIRTEIMDSSSIYYYPRLMNRMVSCDTTLNLEEYRHLYYGYIFQKEFEPYKSSNDEKKLLKYYHSKSVKKKDYPKIIELANHSISEFPFDLRQMNFLCFSYYKIGNEDMARKIGIRYSGIMDAIFSSGDGKTLKSAFHVISVSHEYTILRMFDIQMTSQSLIGDCDYLSLEKNSRNIEGIYFNIGQLLKANLQKLELK